MTTADDRRKSLLARQLAKHFDNLGGVPTACACTGLGCRNFGCSTWWMIFLNEFDADKLERMLDLYQMCQRWFLGDSCK